MKIHDNVVKEIEAQKRYQSLQKERQLEVEDDEIVLEQKCARLAELIESSDSIVLYTGAGISTSASIPDYRGPNGVWTQLKNGCALPKVNDIVCAEPTYTHMAITQLVREGLVQHVVSQNCDGLHLRSGLPPRKLSEVHGNMFVEVCRKCNKLYHRSFDVTERTSLRRHDTGRKCHNCPPEQGTLIDTIVHFGEKGKLKQPLNWKAAVKAVNQADLIICLGTSLKILKKYACLWPCKSRKDQNPKLVIVNLQWTPKDSQATLKINAKCDLVMQRVMDLLQISVSPYDRSQDQIMAKCVPLRETELETCNRITLHDLYENKIDQAKLNITPGWFGKGMKRKLGS